MTDYRTSWIRRVWHYTVKMCLHVEENVWVGIFTYCSLLSNQLLLVTKMGHDGRAFGKDEKKSTKSENCNLQALHGLVKSVI